MTMERSPAIQASTIIKQPHSLGSNRAARESDGKNFKDLLNGKHDGVKSDISEGTSEGNAVDVATEDSGRSATEMVNPESAHSLQTLSFPLWQLAQQTQNGRQTGSGSAGEKMDSREEREAAASSMLQMSNSKDDLANSLVSAETKTRKARQQPADRSSQPEISHLAEMKTKQGRSQQIPAASNITEAMARTVGAPLEPSGSLRQAERSLQGSSQDGGNSKTNFRTDSINIPRIRVQVIEPDARDRESREELPGKQQESKPAFALYQSPVPNTGSNEQSVGPALQISDRIGISAAEMLHDATKETMTSPVRQLVMRLHPEELGEVRVSLRMDRGHLTISIEAVERSAADLLHRDRDMLESLITAVTGDGGSRQVTVSVRDAGEDLSDRSSHSGLDQSGWNGERQGADAGRSPSRRPGDSSSGNEVGSGMIGDRETNHDEPSSAGRRLPGVIVV